MPSDSLREFTSTKYVLGASLNIGGLIVENENIAFEERSANFTQLTLLYEEGSCPYLMSRRDEQGGWLERGKILHTARGPDNEYQEIVDYQGLRKEFRLEEREPEVAYIDEARLTIHLRNGQTRDLSPDITALEARDDTRVVLGWGDAVEFSFQIPLGIEPDEVERSELIVSGFYEPYSTVQLAAASDPPFDQALGINPVPVPLCPTPGGAIGNNISRW